MKFSTIFRAAAADCPDEFQRHSQSIHKLNEMIDIKSKVIEDATAIRDKFPCIDMAVLLLERFVSNFAFCQIRCVQFVNLIHFVYLGVHIG